MIRTLISLSIIAVTVLVIFFGLRVDLVAIQSRIEPTEVPIIVNLTLKNGNVLTASLIKEYPSKTTVSLDDSEITFLRDELISMEILSAEELASKKSYQDLLASLATKDPIFTFKREDRLIDFEKTTEEQEKRKKIYAQIGAQKKKLKGYQRLLIKPPNTMLRSNAK